MYPKPCNNDFQLHIYCTFWKDYIDPESQKTNDYCFGFKILPKTTLDERIFILKISINSFYGISAYTTEFPIIQSEINHKLYLERQRLKELRNKHYKT
jgi:hypothetical protein